MVNIGAIIGGIIGTILFGLLYINYDSIFGPLSVPTSSPFYFDLKPFIILFAIIFFIIFIIGFFVDNNTN